MRDFDRYRFIHSSSLCVGNGLIVLLHGAPGVGKTSTAGKRPT